MTYKMSTTKYKYNIFVLLFHSALYGCQQYTSILTSLALGLQSVIFEQITQADYVFEHSLFVFIPKF